MNAKAYFGNCSTNIRLEVTDDNGETTREYFSSTSELVNYCNESGIELNPETDCVAGW